VDLENPTGYSNLPESAALTVEKCVTPAALWGFDVSLFFSNPFGRRLIPSICQIIIIIHYYAL